MSPARALRLASAMMLALILAAPSAGAGSLGLDLEVGAVSAYVFRGMVLNPDPAVQPALTLTTGGLSLETWASLNLTDEFGTTGEAGEIDVILAYAFESGRLDASFGVGHYRYATPDSGHTTELLAELSVAAVVEPRILLAYDVDAADGLYARIAVGLPLELVGTVTLDLEAGVGYGTSGSNDYNFEVPRGALVDATTSATLEGGLGGSLSWWIQLASSSVVDSDLRAAARDLYGDADVVVGSVGFVWTSGAAAD